ncbi:MAG: putative Ig domain-containing protein, partial [Bacteroidales bacterium]|nr:putative Ig domain-containing protein [Bacteroidales bacterium]
TLNAHLDAPAGYGLRVRNPSNTRELIISAPSTTYSGLEFSYAVHRTNNGAQLQSLWFSPDKGETWQQAASGIAIAPSYEVKVFDLSSYPEVNDNPDLLLRVLFTGQAASNTSGNNRFDNIVLKVATLRLDTLAPAPGMRGRQYKHSFSAKYGSAPYRYKHVSGRLPDGLQLSSDGVLSGVPERPGTYSFRLEVTDQKGAYDGHSFLMTVYEPSLVHYWHFNDLEDRQHESVMTDFSAYEEGVLSYPGSGAGYMDRTEGTTLNTWQGVLPGYGLRVRNPSANRYLMFRAPSTGFRYLQFSFAVHRTSNGAQWQQLQYSPDGGQSWINVGDPYRIGTDYNRKTFNLQNKSDTWDNPDLLIRILFLGPEAGNTSGNNRFDNIALWGVVPPPGLSDRELFVFPNPVTQGVVKLLRPHNVSVFDSMGRRVLYARNTDSIVLPVLSSGVYYILTDDGKYAKIIIP